MVEEMDIVWVKRAAERNTLRKLRSRTSFYQNRQPAVKRDFKRRRSVKQVVSVN